MIQSPIATVKPELRLFALEDLMPAPFNPPSRTERKKLKALRDSILKLGRLLYPPLVSPEGKILDGHRRIAVLRELGVSEVWCIVAHTALIQTFTMSNTTQEAFTGRSWAVVSSLGVDPSLIPGETGRRLQHLQEIGGQELIDAIVENGLGAGLDRVVREVAGKTGLRDRDGQALIAKWLIAFDGQRRAREAINLGGVSELRLAIERNRALLRRDGKWVVDGLPQGEKV